MIIVKLLTSLQNLFNSRIFRLSRNIASVIPVEKSVVTHQIEADIRKFIQEGKI